MNARLRIVTAILGCLVAAAPAIAQGSARLAVGPDAGGYLCPDGRQLYVKSCYDELPDAGCGVVNMHLPSHNGFQRVTTEIRSQLTSSVAGCKIYPLEFRDGVVSLVLPKSAAPAQTAKAPAATPAPSAATPTIPGPATRTALIRISGPGVAAVVHYVDEASAKPTGQKDVVEIWALQVFPNGDPDFPNAHALWIRYDIDCKKNTARYRAYGEIDRQGKVLRAKSMELVQPVVKNSPVEKIAAAACKSTPLGGSRMLTVAAAIADANSAAAPKTAAATPAAKPVAVAPPAKAPIHLPNTDSEKLFFQMVRENKFQSAINALLKVPEDKRKSLVELTDEQAMTPLHWAAANRNAAAIRWLLDKSSKFDLADQKGRTPLRIAIDNKDERVITLLLNRGANANLAWLGHADELKGLKNTDELVDYLIKNAAPAAN